MRPGYSCLCDRCTGRVGPDEDCDGDLLMSDDELQGMADEQAEALSSERRNESRDLYDI